MDPWYVYTYVYIYIYTHIYIYIYIDCESINDPSHCPIAFPDELVSKHSNKGQWWTNRCMQLLLVPVSQRWEGKRFSNFGAIAVDGCLRCVEADTFTSTLRCRAFCSNRAKPGNLWKTSAFAWKRERCEVGELQLLVWTPFTLVAELPKSSGDLSNTSLWSQDDPERCRIQRGKRCNLQSDGNTCP